ncbi:MAG TPA: calcium/sodium antiporter [Thermotogota bacterium]|nr:calcium/sodium antiporter [Thermotogota bacterium]
MFVQFVVLVIGIVSLIKGADWLVDGSSGLARSFGVSPLFIGLTIVAFGTSAPELAVSLSAALKGAGEISISNVVGSNIANTALVIGLSTLILPMGVKYSTIRKEIPFCLLVSIVLMAFLIQGKGYGLERSHGIALLAFLVVFLEYTFVMARGDRAYSREVSEQQSEATASGKMKRSKAFFLTGLGLALVLVGGECTVNASVQIALALGVSQAFVGLTIIAIGTSLPELVTSLSAILKKEADLAIGNIVGSNVFNILLILGLSSSIHPMTVFVPLYWLDLLYMTLLVGLLWIFSFTKRQIERWEGGILFASYIAYLVLVSLRR